MKRAIKIIAVALAAVLCGTFGTIAVKGGQDSAYAVIVKAGSNKENIKKVQQKLKDYGYYTAAVDGIYGSRTTAAVRKFQQNNKLKVDGIVGPQTLGALGLKLGTGSTSSSTSNSDLNLLAKCVYAEARGEPYVGRVAVAAVVLNRVKHPDFPNTIAGVIYQPYAFTAVADGQINLTPDSESRRAAQDALNGWDPTYGSIYYYNPAVATSKWIFGRRTVTTIGKHVFAV